MSDHFVVNVKEKFALRDGLVGHSIVQWNMTVSFENCLDGKRTVTDETVSIVKFKVKEG